MPTIDLSRPPNGTTGNYGGRILDPSGRPYTHGPDSDLALPHAYQSAGLAMGGLGSYLMDRWDEALRNGRQEANSMRRDAFIASLLQERALAVTSLPIRVEVDNDRDPVQKALAEGLQAIVNQTPYLNKLRYCLQEETTWIGRAGTQLAWKWKVMDLPAIPVKSFSTGMNGTAAPPSQMTAGAQPTAPSAQPTAPAQPGMDPARSAPQKRRALVIANHQPISGDSIVHELDGTPGLLIYARAVNELPGARIIRSNKGPALALEGAWRRRFILDNHIPQASEFFDFERGESIFGIGIRTLIFWINWLRLEGLELVFNWITRVGLGVRLWYYQGGNPQSKLEVSNAALAQDSNVNLLVPRFGDKAVEGVDFIETATAGAQLMMDFQHFLKEELERMIVGQVMSSGKDQEGSLGGTGRAKLAESTKNKIVKFDAVNRCEALTEDWLKPMQRWTYPEHADIPARFVSDVDETDPKELLEAAKTYVDMGGEVADKEVGPKLGFKAPLPGDKLLKPSAQQQPQPGMPGSQPGAGGAPGQPAPAQLKQGDDSEAFNFERVGNPGRYQAAGFVELPDDDESYNDALLFPDPNVLKQDRPAA